MPNFRILFLLSGLFVLLASGSVESQTTQSVAEQRIQFGIDGKFRSGRWTPLFFESISGSEGFQVQGLDGEAVRYQTTITFDSKDLLDGTGCTFLPAGPPGSPLEVRLIDSSSNFAGIPIYRKRLLEGLVASDRTWIVALGETLGLDEIGRNDLLGIRGALDVSLVRQRTQIPDSWLGLDGVDLLVISGSSTKLLRSLSADQQKALERWILEGGHVLVSLGSKGPQLFQAAPWLASLLEVDGDVSIFQAEPESVETFVSAKTPIRPFMATRISDSGDITLLSGRNAERQMVPLITLHSVGLGKATVFAGGLEEDPFAGWKQYPDLIDRMLPDLMAIKPSRRDTSAITTDVRYEDVAGQVRVSLDRFVTESGTSFSVIAAVVLTLVGLIGPLDYFLVNRWLGRPLLGWLSFPITIAAFSLAMVLWNRQALPTSINRVTVLDMDSETRVGRAFSWSQLYTDDAAKFDLQYVLQSPNGAENEEQLTAPWGYPGEVYGGIQVAGEDIRLPAYQLESQFGIKAPLSSRLVDVPLAPKSSRGFASRWRFEGQSLSVIDLKRRVGSDLLTGSLLNPFDADLLDGYLIYRNLAYIMPTRVPANSRIASIENLPTKNFRWRLNRRQTAEESTRSEVWNPASDDNLDRLMEIVMFYKAAGGSKYVGLDNSELAELDLSEILAMDKAILVGRIARAPAELRVNGESLADEHINDLTYVRMILPITGQVGRRSSSGN